MVRFVSISDVYCQRLTRERAYSPVLKYNEGLWKSQPPAHWHCGKIMDR